MTEFTEFLTIEAIASLAGCVALVTIFTQIFKWFIKANIDPKWFALGWSVVLVVARQIFVVRLFTAEDWFLCSINIIICVGVSVGIGYEAIIKPIQQSFTGGGN